jgi:tetratricopeptide (TPR) repeat protein
MAATLALAAQGPPSPASAPGVNCEKDPSVDEYIREIHKRRRNKNPLPSDACIFGWCREAGGGHPAPEPPPAPRPAAKPPAASSAPPPHESSSSEARSPSETPPPDLSDYDPIRAAKSAEAGDYYFGEKNYAAALSRYQEALEDKPGDAAIHLRLGRTFEKLDKPGLAFEHYDASLILDAEGPSAAASREALARLRPQLEKSGLDPEAIHARNASTLSTPCRLETPARSR